MLHGSSSTGMTNAADNMAVQMRLELALKRNNHPHGAHSVGRARGVTGAAQPGRCSGNRCRAEVEGNNAEGAVEPRAAGAAGGLPTSGVAADQPTRWTARCPGQLAGGVGTFPRDGPSTGASGQVECEPSGTKRSGNGGSSDVLDPGPLPEPDGEGCGAGGQRERDRAQRVPGPVGLAGCDSPRDRPSIPARSKRLAVPIGNHHRTSFVPLGQRPTAVRQEPSPALLAGSKPRRSPSGARGQGAGGSSGREPRCREQRAKPADVAEGATGAGSGAGPETGLRNGRRSE